jgi:hypothetical protein
MALMISSLSTIASNIIIQGKATTLLHKIITQVEKSRTLPAHDAWQEGEFTLRCKPCAILTPFSSEVVPFQLVKITISWQPDQSISGIVGMLV